MKAANGDPKAVDLAPIFAAFEASRQVFFDGVASGLAA